MTPITSYHSLWDPANSSDPYFSRQQKIAAILTTSAHTKDAPILIRGVEPIVNVRPGMPIRLKGTA